MSDDTNTGAPQESSEPQADQVAGSTEAPAQEETSGTVAAPKDESDIPHTER